MRKNGLALVRKVIQIPESGNFRLVESGIREIFSAESGMLGFGIRYSAKGIRNPTNDWRQESKFH